MNVTKMTAAAAIKALGYLMDDLDVERQDWANPTGEYREAIAALSALAEENAALNSRVEHLENRLRVEFATSVETAEQARALKAEVEAMKPSCLTCFGAGKIQAHPTIVCPKCGGTGKQWSVAWKARAETAEARLAVLKPLIEIIERAVVHPVGDFPTYWKRQITSVALAVKSRLSEQMDAEVKK